MEEEEEEEEDLFKEEEEFIRIHVFGTILITSSLQVGV